MAKPKISIQRQTLPTVTDAYNNLLGITDDSHFINISLFLLDEIEEQPFPINESKIQQIADSIENVGILEPLIVTPNGDRYKILSGRHRFRACKLLGKDTIPCYVKKDISADIARYILIATNTDRNNEYKPSVYAKAYAEQKELMKKLGKKTVSSIAEKNGMNSKQIYRYIRLTYLIDEFMDWVDDEKIAFMTGVELSYLTDEQQSVILNFMLDKSMLEKDLTLETAQRLHKAVDNLNGDTQKFEDNIENIFCNKSDTVKAMNNEEHLTEKKTNIDDDTDYEQENNGEHTTESDFSEDDFEEKPVSEKSKTDKKDKKDDFAETVKGYMILALQAFGISDDEILESQLDCIFVNNSKKQAIEAYRKGI